MYPDQYSPQYLNNNTPYNPTLNNPHDNHAALSLLSILTAASVLLFLYAFVYGPTEILPYAVALLFVSIRRHLSTVLFVSLIVSVLFMVFIGPQMVKDLFISIQDIFWFSVKIFIPTLIITMMVVYLFKKIKTLHIYYVILFISAVYAMMGYMYVHDQKAIIPDQSDIFQLATKEERLLEANKRYENIGEICGIYYSMVLRTQCYVDLDRTLENIRIRIQTFTSDTSI